MCISGVRKSTTGFTPPVDFRGKVRYADYLLHIYTLKPLINTLPAYYQDFFNIFTNNSKPCKSQGFFISNADDMKKLNDTAIKVLTALLEKTDRILDNDNGKVREVQARVDNTIGNYRFINLTYYLNEDGYLFREPEINICQDTETGDYMPMGIIYEEERIMSNSISFVYGTLKLINEKIQSDHAEITNDFLMKLGERHGLL